MKLLKWSLVVGAVLGLSMVIGGMLLPAQTSVRREVQIDASPAAVFARLDSFESFAQWSPWARADPEAVYTLEGPAQGVGARMSWSGNAAIGSGTQQITASNVPTRVDTVIEFGARRTQGRFDLAARDGGTRLAWTLHSEHGYNPLDRWFGVLLLERMLGPDQEIGLANLKALVERREEP